MNSVGWFALHGQQVVRAVGGQEPGGGVLGVRSVSGDDHVGQVHTVEQDRQPGYLAGVGAHVDLGQHDTVVVVERGQQVPGRTVRAG